MNKFLGFLAAALLFTSLAFASPSVQFRYAPNSQGEYQLAVNGHDLCDSTKFRIRVSSEVSGETGWYTSHSGLTEWPVNKGCTLNMHLAKSYLVPGNILEVRTYAFDGHRTHSFAAVIPCEEARWATVFADGQIYETAILSALGCSGGSLPIPGPVPPADPGPVCQVSAAATGINPELAVVSVTCSQPIPVAVAVYSGADGRILCDNQRFYADQSQAPVCNIQRDRTRRLDYKVRVNDVRTGALLVNSGGTIVKDPTFNFPAQGQLLSSPVMTPPSQSKALGRGQFWDVKIVARVTDNDVDPSEGQYLIKVQLIDTTGGANKILKTQNANSGAEVAFDLEHQYVTPKLFGKPYEDGDLRKGRNTVKVRVWDAYNGNRFVDLPEVTINIQ